MGVLTDMTISVLIADDHPIVLRGLKALIDGDTAFTVVATANEGAGAIEALRQAAPDIAVLDLNMPSISGLEVLALAQNEGMRTKIVILAAAASDGDIHAAVTGGVRGLLFKESAPQALMDCLHAVARGASWLPDEIGAVVGRETARLKRWQARASVLTQRELELVRFVSRGRSNKEIAFALQLSEGTVKVHLNNIFRKLEVATRTQLIALVGASRSEADRSAQRVN
jgi:DNA-binding NarL/FixJ family response regulator